MSNFGCFLFFVFVFGFGVVFFFFYVEGALMQVVKLQKPHEVLPTSANTVGCTHKNVLRSGSEN